MTLATATPRPRKMAPAGTVPFDPTEEDATAHPAEPS